MSRGLIRDRMQEINPTKRSVTRFIVQTNKRLTFMSVWAIIMAITILGGSKNLSAQIDNNFTKIFERETQSSTRTQQKPQFKNVTRLSYLPDTLPTWFFTPPQSPHDKIYSIGISDPDLPLEEAHRQAIHRAQAKASILKSARIEYFRDFFSTAQSQSKSQVIREQFDTYFRISSNTNTNLKNYTIINQHITRYNEFIVLLSLDLSPHEDTTSSKIQTRTIGTVLYVEVQFDEVYEPQAEYTLVTTQEYGNQSKFNSKFNLVERGRRYQSTSKYMDEVINYPTYPYKYTNPSWPEQSDPIVYYEGLWSLYIRNFMRQLCLTSEQSSILIKSLGQQYMPETTNLSREVATFNVKIQLNGIVFGKDSVGFDMQLNEFSPY